MSPRRSLLLALTLSLSLLASACAGSSAEGAADSFTDVDVAFLEGMVPHHGQAVVMAQMVEGTTAHPEELVPLAEAIIGAQESEIEQMTALLAAAGAEPPADGMADHDMDDMGDGEPQMSGMMSEADMTGLAESQGEAFDGLFLTMMIAHHEGAIESAEQVLDQPEGNPEVAALAEDIIAAQRAEIAQMEGWQEDWGV